MSTATRIGAQWALVSSNTVYDPIRGAQIVTVYESDTTATLGDLLGTVPWYYRYEIDTSDTPKVRVTVYSPEATDAPVWELLSNSKEKDLLEHPSAKAVSEEDIKTLINFLKKPIAGSDPAFTGGGTGGIPTAMKLYRLMLEGTRKYFVEDYVLRYTVTVTNAVALNVAYSNVDRLFTPAQLATPATSGITLPAGIATSIGTITAASPLPSDHLWSWLKRAPTARQSQIGKVTISGEWWLQAWSTFIYAPM